MGCTTTHIDQTNVKIIKLDYRQVNMYIDRLPLVVIQKLKQKFDSYSNDEGQLLFHQFQILYAPYLKQSSTHSPTLSHRLYLFYNDLNPRGLKFRNFISKYATINYCQQNILSDIIFFLAAQAQFEEQIISQKQYQSFVATNTQFFTSKPNSNIPESIDKQAFIKSLNDAGFLWQEYRKRFMVMEKQDLPFDAIGKGLIDMDINDFDVGKDYYILSSSWFERWSYYYQGIQQQSSLSKIKSTKLLKKKASIGITRRKQSLKHRSNSRDMSMQVAQLIIQRPTLITFDDIEGQFFGELKQKIRIHYECKIVSQELWQLFKKTMPPEYQIKRVAISVSSLELYPKNIYFLQTDSSGLILPASLKNILVPMKKKLYQILQDQPFSDPSVKTYYFTKNLGDNLWSEEEPDTMVGKCSSQNRFFLVKTTSKIGFIENYFRKKKEQSNITYGDKVYSYFAFNKKIIPAFVMNKPTKNTAIIHYCGFSYRYQIEVPIDSLSIQSNGIEESLKNPQKSVKSATENFSFKGIRNIGNTCFINTVVQCLIGCPVMGTYLYESHFKKNTQPLLYEISQLAKDLLMNKKVSPVEMKKTIDTNLEMFSGYNQHDAQQFLGYLLDKFSEQIMPPNKTKSNKDIKPNADETIVDHLFSGVVQSQIVCKSCGESKKIDERALIVSLPIPEPEYNIYTIYCFPIYDTKIRRVILRLHRTSRLKDYVKAFEDRLGVQTQDYIFVEVQSGVTKRIREDFYPTFRENPLLCDLGFTSNSQIHAFQKITDRDLRFIKEQNRTAHRHKVSKYFDFYNSDENKWIFSRLIETQGTKTTLQLMDQESTFSLMKLKDYPENDIKPLGQQVNQKVSKKLINRRYNSALQKMEPFGFHYMVSYHKQISYRQLRDLINIVMKNFIEPRAKKIPFSIKINQANKGKCLFCQKVQGQKKKNSQEKEVKGQKCCVLTEQQMEIPLIWIAKQKLYSVFVEWEDLDLFCTSFASVAEVDILSSAAEKTQQEEKINVEDCLDLLQQPEEVEIECEKCKHKEAKKLQLLKEVPNILVLHMKEFRYTPDHMLVKMDVNIKWIQYLDISKYSVNKSGCLYELFAYICHTGSGSSGHYTSMVKRKHLFENKKVWVSFDDDQTEIIEGEQKNIDSAYLLFFKKVDMPNSSYVNFNVMKELDTMTISKQLSKQTSK